MFFFLQRNLVWMLLALGLSVALWTVVTTQENPEVVDVFQAVPVELRNVPDKLSVTNDVPSVNVVVSAPRDAWPELRPAKFQASVDLSRVGPGVQELPIDVHSIDSRARIVDVNPAKAIVRLEPIKKKDVPVRVLMHGDLAPGYRAQAAKATPDTVSVTGPASAVDQVAVAAADVNLAGVTSSINQVYKVVPQTSTGDRVDRVSVDKENVVVEVPIEQDQAFKAVPISAQIRGAPATGYQVIGLRTDPTAITIQGEPRVIDGISFVSTQPVDLNNAAGDLSVNADLQLPPGVKTTVAPSPIVVRVFVAPIEGSKILDVAPTVQNVPAQRSTVNPSSVRLVLAGPMPVLTGLGPKDAKVTLDGAGLTPGTHKLAPKVEVPSLIRVQSIQPDQIDLTILPPATATPAPTPPAATTP
jgi:YbbR domain-containing protein